MITSSNKTPATEKDMDDILALCKAADQPYAFMDSEFQVAEVEVLAWETFQACKINHRWRKGIFSYKGNIHNSGGGLNESLTMYNQMVAEGWFIESHYEGIPIIIPTRGLIDVFLNQMTTEGRIASIK